jgi:tRNA threonylcarbamoyl adenosine modification protein YeaZ
MKILAIEFSSPRRSVAVLDGALILAEQAEAAGQTVSPLRLVEQALAAAKISREQIECVVVGLGPGSYTGIRGAIALAQGWQLATGVKLLGVSSADGIAAHAQAEKVFGRVNVVIDAQRGEFYHATYDISDKSIKNTSNLNIVSLTEIQSVAKSINPFVGPEIARWVSTARILFPTAVALGQLAAARTDFVSGEELEPIYLRATTFVKAAPPRVI